MYITTIWFLIDVNKTSALYVDMKLRTSLAYILFYIFRKVSVTKESKLACFPHIPELSLLRIHMRAGYKSDSSLRSLPQLH